MDLVENVSNDVIGDLNIKNGEEMKIISNATNLDDSKAIAKRDSQTAIQMINNYSPKIKKHILCSPYDPEYFLKGFILLVGTREDIKNNIIRNSCNFCALAEPRYQFQFLDSIHYSSLYIENQLITTGEGTSVKKARLDVSMKAFNILKDKCFTLMIKESIEIVSLKNVLSGITISSTTLSSPIDSGIQTVMDLKKNSELEKKGTEHKEPITVVQFQKNLKVDASTTETDGQFDKQEINPALELAIKEYLILFLKGPKTRFKFLSEFSKEERTCIHLICGDFGLKSKSYGDVFNRYIVVKKRQSAIDIFNDLINNGYENDQYILIPPKQ